MSHFAVLAVLPGSTPLEKDAIQEALEQAMQPYHEFECTGNDDQYVQNIDITARVRREYEDENHNMDGNWYSRGRMGWFGCSIGDVGGNEWSGNFDSLWDMIPDDDIITVVDCHI